MIKVENLSKQFTRNVIETEDKSKKKTKKNGLLQKSVKKPEKEDFFAVDHISFEVKKGEIVGILGPNGAGKTTLLRMLGNLMEPTEGRVTISKEDGEVITDPVEMKRSIGYLSGNTKLFRRISTREMLRMFGDIYGMTREETDEKITQISSVLSMDDFLDNRIERLSTGQTQRASIARCLIHSPKLYIFDEPTLGLDIISADAIVSFMKKQKEEGKTVLYSTHYLEEAQFLCDRILMIYKGRIVAQGSPKELMDKTGSTNLRDAFHDIMKHVPDSDSPLIMDEQKSFRMTLSEQNRKGEESDES